MTDKEAWVMFAASRAAGTFNRFANEEEIAHDCAMFADEMLKRMQNRWGDIDRVQREQEFAR